VTSRDDEQSTQVIHRADAQSEGAVDSGSSPAADSPAQPLGPLKRGRKSVGDRLSRVADGSGSDAAGGAVAAQASPPGSAVEPVAVDARSSTQEVTKHSKSSPPRAPRPRRARLTASRVDPWSVMKMAFMLSIALGIMTLVGVLVVWNVLNASGVFDSINSTVSDVLGATSTTKFDINNYVGFNKVAGFTTLICVVDVVLLTALATLGAFLYNLSASLLGGVEVTLAEEE
jgi:Transmembrane domain of unknown function (DUF3566)